MKIANGEYIAPEKIEAIYQKCPYIAEAFVNANSNEEYVIAFFFPEVDVFMKFAKEKGFNDSLEELVENEKFLALMHLDLRAHCKKELASFE